jgi:hypothetical protein
MLKHSMKYLGLVLACLFYFQAPRAALACPA